MTSFALSNRYWVGSLPIWMKLAYYVSQRPMMLGVFTLLLALALAGPAYIFFRRQAQKRLARQDDHA
jgi:cellulose synthase (UDP-forming)